MSDNYVEFGTGGSTVLACKNVHKTVISIDSDIDWIEKVQLACRDQETPIRPNMVYVDIGKTGEWGLPIDPDTRARWPQYHEAIWQNPHASDADLYFVDGRFRVACFIQALLHSAPRSFIMIHDFADRPHYHVVRRFAREIAASGQMSAFQRLPNVDYAEMMQCLQEHRYNAA